jgi:NAD(P)-dependent dehydrogenase (short-subunit alcohol dehydrogenase family)
MTKQPGSAIVVGGGSGIGRATVLALAAAGTRVWAVGRDRARLEQMLAALGLAEVEHNAKNNRMRAAGTK